jgi:hypothetical protein
MKKLVTMVAILGVLAFCLPSYGGPPHKILIYKVAVSGKAMDMDDEEFESGGIQGYLVIDCIDSGYPNVNDEVLIVYGRDDDGDKIQMYFQDSGSSEVFDGYYDWFDLMPNTPMYININLYSDSYGYNVLQGIIIGQFKNTNIGADEKWLVPKSLDGNGILWYDVFNGNSVDGSGTISLRLQEVWTKRANKNGDDLGDTVDYIEGILAAAGYTDDWGSM